MENLTLTFEQAFQLALQQHQSGDLETALDIYRQLLAVAPAHFGAIHMTGVALLQQGHPGDALPWLERAVGQQPQHAKAQANYGNALRALGRRADAVKAYQLAVALAPELPALHSNLAAALNDVRDPIGAEQAARQALALAPPTADVLNNLGVALRAQHQLNEALAVLQQAVAMAPGLAEAHNNLGSVLRDLGRGDEAIAAYRQALTLQPDDDKALNNLGVALREHGDMAGAAQALRRAAHHAPDHLDAWINLANVLADQGALDEAVAILEQQVLPRDPHSAAALNNLGTAALLKGEHARAQTFFEQSARLAAQSSDDNTVVAHARNNLGNALSGRQQLDEAVLSYHSALALAPDFADAYCNLGTARLDQGMIDEALGHLRQARTLKPESALIHSNWLFALNFAPDWPSVDVAAEHRAFGRRYDSAAVPPPRRPKDGRIRLGLLSPDFREHPVARFILPLLRHLDRRRFQIYAYANHPQVDAVTQQLQRLCERWQRIDGLTDAAADAAIRADQLDILLDLAGHTANNRMPLLAKKPAPCQISWLGYLNTTGLAAMDLRITDSFADPPGMTEHLYTEQLLRLPHSQWCYAPREDAPLPQVRQDHTPRLGSFNQAAKLNNQVLDTWATVLQELPSAILRIVGVPVGAAQQRILQHFATHGIAAERLELLPKLTLDSYFNAFHDVDVALDPFPYNGGTTTCDALWMGVPVVTLAGNHSVARGGVSLLSNLGLTDWIAASPTDYRQRIGRLLADRPSLNAWRNQLREQFRKSPLYDAAGFSQAFAAALESAVVHHAH